MAWWRAQAESMLPSINVVMKGVPLRVEGGEGQMGDEASVDSELTLLPRVAGGVEPKRDGPFPNPIFDTEIEHVDFREHGFCLVTRLDGYTYEDARALVTRAEEAVWYGTFLVDLRGDGHQGDGWLRRAGRAIEERGRRVTVEETRSFVAYSD